MIIDEEYIEHVGVKGMKWGFRKGSNETGVNPVVGAKMDINSRRIYRRQQRLDKTGYPVSAALGRAFMGQERQKRLQKQKISSLRAQNKRLLSGKLTTMDKLGTYGQLPFSALGMPLPIRGPSLGGVIVSRTPRVL